MNLIVLLKLMKYLLQCLLRNIKNFQKVLLLINKIQKIKKKKPDFSNIDAIDNFIGSKTYNEISNGQYHDNWFKELEENNFLDKKTKKKIIHK